jgi:hypothetical protein
LLQAIKKDTQNGENRGETGTDLFMNEHEDKEELERLILAHTPRFQTLTKAAENRIQASDGMGHNEFWDTVSKTGETVCAEPICQICGKTGSETGESENGKMR